MNITVRKAIAADIEKLMDILNSATKKLLDKGVMQWEYPWDTQEVQSFITKEEFYIAEYEGVPCACFGLKPFCDNYFVPQDKTGLYWYHLAVHPDYDKLGIGYMLCRWVHDFAQENKISIYFDCWAGNNSLRNYYSFNGFEFIGEFPEEDYFVAAFKTK